MVDGPEPRQCILVSAVCIQYNLSDIGNFTRPYMKDCWSLSRIWEIVWLYGKVTLKDVDIAQSDSTEWRQH